MDRHLGRHSGPQRAVGGVEADVGGIVLDVALPATGRLAVLVHADHRPRQRDIVATDRPHGGAHPRLDAIDHRFVDFDLDLHLRGSGSRTITCRSRTSIPSSITTSSRQLSLWAYVTWPSDGARIVHLAICSSISFSLLTSSS